MVGGTVLTKVGYARYARRARRVIVSLALTLGATLLVVAPASAETAPYGGGSSDPTVKSVPPSDAEASEATRAEGDSLPFTGGDIGGLVALGLVGVAGGTALVLRSRRANPAR
jgi:hypothetical protein